MNKDNASAPKKNHARTVDAFLPSRAAQDRGTAERAGEDLTEEDLDDLYDSVCLGDRTPTLMACWWRDKPEQILHRILSRMTRAERTLAERSKAPQGK